MHKKIFFSPQIFYIEKMNLGFTNRVKSCIIEIHSKRLRLTPALGREAESLERPFEGKEE